LKNDKNFNIMRKFFFLFCLFGGIVGTRAQVQIPLRYTPAPGVIYENGEKTYYSRDWATTVVTNVSVPTMTVYQPSADRRNGTAVVIAPGGGLYALSINSEGTDVANWLVAKGVTAFVLRYRLVPTGEDGVADFSEFMANDPEALLERVQQVLPSSVQDGLTAVEYVREHAGEYGVEPDRIGFMGFSAGGAVTLGVGYLYEKGNRPDFLAPVYPWTDAMPVRTPPADAPPMFVVCATNDGVGLAPGAVDLYKSYLDNGFSAELHMYSRGDHGFGMRVQDMPTDDWIERFYEWAVVEGIIKPRKK
jgi:acetyl esterase/lipase